MKIGYACSSMGNNNLAEQLNSLKKAGCKWIFKEEISSRKHRNPELLRMLESVSQGDTVIVYDLLSFAHSLYSLIELIEHLAEKEIEFISLKDAIDTSKTTNQLLCILQAVRTFENKIKSIQTKSGLASVKKRGVQIGRRPGLSSESKAAAKKAMTMYKKGDTVKEICHQLNISKATFYRYIHITISKKKQGKQS